MFLRNSKFQLQYCNDTVQQVIVVVGLRVTFREKQAQMWQKLIQSTCEEVGQRIKLILVGNEKFFT